MCVASSTAAGQLVTTLYNSPPSSGVGQGNTIAWPDIPAARGKPSQASNQGTRVGQHRARQGKARRGEVCVWRNPQPQPTEARLHRGGASPHSCLVLIRPTFSFPASGMLVEKPTTLPLPPHEAAGGGSSSWCVGFCICWRLTMACFMPSSTSIGLFLF